LLEDKRKLTY